MRKLKNILGGINLPMGLLLGMSGNALFKHTHLFIWIPVFLLCLCYSVWYIRYIIVNR
jgi:hypothetical protein